MLFAFLTMKKASLPLAGGGRRAWLEPDVVHVEREAAGGVGDKAVGEPLPIVPLVYYVGDWLAPNHRLDVDVIHPVSHVLRKRSKADVAIFSRGSAYNVCVTWPTLPFSRGGRNSPNDGRRLGKTGVDGITTIARLVWCHVGTISIA